MNGKNHKVQNQKTFYELNGSPKEVFVSWPGQSQQVSSGLQKYIEKKVSKDESIILDGKKIIHNKKTIGMLTKDVINRINPNVREVKVSNVMRYSCGEYFKNNNPDFYSKMGEKIKKKGWFYTVLLKHS